MSNSRIDGNTFAMSLHGSHTHVTSELGRCPERGCPVRWRNGQDQRCAMHGDSDDLSKRAREYGTLMDAPMTAPQTGRVIRGTGRQ